MPYMISHPSLRDFSRYLGTKERKKVLSTQHEISKAEISAEGSKLIGLAHKSRKNLEKYLAERRTIVVGAEVNTEAVLI